MKFKRMIWLNGQEQWLEADTMEGLLAKAREIDPTIDQDTLDWLRTSLETVNDAIKSNGKK